MAERLTTPPDLAPETLRIIPLGGHGDIGRNMSSYEIDGRLLFIDCGVLFPEEHQPGVDLILPALDLVRDRLDDVEGLVLTHGHEDHVGAVPYLLKIREDIPIYGSKLTLGMLQGKLREHRITDADLRVVEDSSIHQIGPFSVEFLAVNHSIPDAMAVVVRTAGGSVLHTGDFKMDQLPLDGRITDLRGFARAGEQGIDLLLADSTNAEVPGFITSERRIEPALHDVFASAQQRLIVACFSSHVHRVQQVLDAAVMYGRKVAYVGRSMVRNMQVARDLGYLRVPGDTVIDIKQLDDYAPEDVVVICTGSQGEPLAALSRIARQEHPVIALKPGDTVLLASSLIPGNENAVSRVINGLARLGARVVHKGNALVHVSGHAPEGELLYVYNIVKPRNVMPVHGEVRHLIRNAQIAASTGIDPSRCLVVEDGGVVDLHDGEAKVVGRLRAGYIFVDGTTVGDVSETELTDRRILGEEGFISVVAVVDAGERKIVSGPDIHARGFAEDDSAFDAIIPVIEEVLLEALQREGVDAHSLQQAVRRTIGRWVNQTYRRRPMILPVVVVA